MDTADLLQEIRRRVIEWERKVWRPFPWRLGPTPYKAMVAQFLLRRTTRTAVARRYPGFLAKYPDVFALAEAPVEEIEHELRELGMYRVRARQLSEAARHIVAHHRGVIPDSWGALIRVPGLGPYGAGAVMSFGHGKRAPVVDANSGRVISRLLGAGRMRLAELLRVAWVLVPSTEHALFNYGLVDLGAYVCTKRKEDCAKCPLKSLCVRATGSPKLANSYRLLLAEAER